MQIDHSKPYLEPNDIDKGLTAKDYRVKFLEQLWFLAKTATPESSNMNKKSKVSIYIEHNYLIQIKCKQGRNKSLEYYWVLAFLYVTMERLLKWQKME